MKRGFAIRPAFTLLELLIAAGVFATLMSAVFTLYFAASTTGIRVRAIRTVTADARRALELISRDVRSADCLTVKSGIVPALEIHRAGLTRSYQVNQLTKRLELTPGTGARAQPVSGPDVEVTTFRPDYKLYHGEVDNPADPRFDPKIRRRVHLVLGLRRIGEPAHRAEVTLQTVATIRAAKQRCS